MHPVIRLREPARQLRFGDLRGQERERHRILVPGLFEQLSKVDCPSIETARRPGLEPLEFEPQPLEIVRQSPGRPLPCPAAGSLRLARVHDRLEKRPRRDDHCSRAVQGTTPDADEKRRREKRRERRARVGGIVGVIGSSLSSLVSRLNPLHHLLPQRQPLRLLDHPLHQELICLFVGLGARAVHGSPFA